MSANTNSQSVLIVGAGIAGLALAQMLRKQNIPCDVFERDAADHVRAQGWAVMLMESLPEFERLIPDDLGDVVKAVSVNRNTNVPDSIALYNSDTLQQFATLGGIAKGEKGFALRASREHLRTYLWQHIPVHGGKIFDHYTENEDGVTAYFRDGTSFHGSMIVGADGAKSRVRKQLVEQSPILSQYINLLGVAPNFPPELFKPIRERGTAGTIGVGRGLRYMVSQHDMAPDMSSGSYYYVVAYESEDSVAEYAWADQASKKELWEKCLEKTAHLPSALTDILRFAGPESPISPLIKYMEYVPPNTLPTGRVTLMGDALHTMIPFRGAGANTAIHDACDLARIIIERHQQLPANTNQTVDWSGLMKEYESIAIPRGQDIVLSSRSAGQDAEKGRKLVEKAGRVNTFNTAATNIDMLAAARANPAAKLQRQASIAA